MKYYPSKSTFDGILFNEVGNYDIIVSEENIEESRKYDLVNGNYQSQFLYIK